MFICSGNPVLFIVYGLLLGSKVDEGLCGSTDAEEVEDDGEEAEVG